MSRLHSPKVRVPKVRGGPCVPKRVPKKVCVPKKYSKKNAYLKSIQKECEPKNVLKNNTYLKSIQKVCVPKNVPKKTRTGVGPELPKNVPKTKKYLNAGEVTNYSVCLLHQIKNARKNL